MEKKEELIERIVREQDLACFYVVKHYNRSVNILEYYSEDNEVMYSDIDKFILDNPQILERLSTKNLMNLLSMVYEEDKKAQIVPIIMERLEAGNVVYCDDIEDSIFMKIVHSSDRAINRLGKDNIRALVAQMNERKEKIQDTRLKIITDNLIYVGDITNFLAYYEQGIFDGEKIAFLERMLEKDKNALRYVNFGIFRDDIFSMSKELIEYLSKFPAMSAQVVIIANNNPELMRVLRDRISGYENLPDNYDEIETLITYFAKKCFQIEVTKDTNISELIDSAFRESSTLNSEIAYTPVKAPFGDNYKERLEEEYQGRYSKETKVDNKLSIYLDKVFSLTKGGAEKFLEEYGADIDNLEGLDEEKELVSKLKEAVRLNSEVEIDRLFSEAVNLYSPSQIFKFSQNLAKACAKSYITEMDGTDRHIQALEEENGQYIEFNGNKVKQIKLSGNFYMLLHSTDTRFIKDTESLSEEIDFRVLWKNRRR